MERIWKEIVTVYWRFYPAICVQGLRKTTKSEVTVVRVCAEYKENISGRREKKRKRTRRKEEVRDQRI